jgi:hypothetical protein
VVPGVGEDLEGVFAVWLKLAPRPERGNVVELGEGERAADVACLLREAAGQFQAADDVRDDLLMCLPNRCSSRRPRCSWATLGSPTGFARRRRISMRPRGQSKEPCVSLKLPM